MGVVPSGTRDVPQCLRGLHRDAGSPSGVNSAPSGIRDVPQSLPHLAGYWMSHSPSHTKRDAG
eukprot:365570-Chlamydomonas_euryale.AAC.1